MEQMKQIDNSRHARHAKDNKELVIIDMGNTVFRSLFQAQNIIGSNEFEEIQGMFMHIVFNSILNVQIEIGKNSTSEIILAWDYSGKDGYWRKDVFEGYKSQRKGDRDKNAIDFNKVFECLNNTIMPALDELFPYKNVRVYRAEADDIIAVLCKEYGHDKNITIVSVDKDLLQLTAYGKHGNIRQYQPIKQEFIEPSEIVFNGMFVEKHILLGDKVDNIDGVFKYCIFAPQFLSYLKSDWGEKITADFEELQLDRAKNGGVGAPGFTYVSELIDLDDIISNVEFITTRDYFPEIVDNYTVVDKYGDKIIWKEMWIGEKYIENYIHTLHDPKYEEVNTEIKRIFSEGKIVKGVTGVEIPEYVDYMFNKVLEEFKTKKTPVIFNDYPRIVWERRYIMNKQLIDLSCIPDELEEKIRVAYNEQYNVKSNPVKVQEFLLENNLMELYNKSGMFFTAHGNLIEENKEENFLDDFE